MKRDKWEESIHKKESPPTRGRGLKPVSPPVDIVYYDVAPHAGAWIETGKWNSSPTREVAPHARALIESLNTVLMHPTGFVAPHAGAWIETLGSKFLKLTLDVAPHAGAWIETRT